MTIQKTGRKAIIAMVAILTASLFIGLAADLVNTGPQGGEVAPSSDLLLTGGSGLSKPSGVESEFRETGGAVPQQRSVDSGFEPVGAIDRQVIITASLGLNVSSVTRSVEELRAIAVGLGGYVSDAQLEPIRRSENPRGIVTIRPYGWATVTLRIPADRFHEAVLTVKNIGVMTAYRMSSKDVTKEYVDLNARLKNLQGVLEQYRLILLKAQKIEDILQVQNRIDNVQGQIEALTSNLRYLQSQVAHATITVILTEPYSTVEPPKPSLFDQFFAEPLSLAYMLLRAEVAGLILITVGALPLSPFALAGYLLHRRASRRTNTPGVRS